MAASNAESGMGVTLTWDSDAVGEITNDLGFQTTTEMIDVTKHGSDDDYTEYIPGLKDGGEITVEMNLYLTDTGQAGLLTDYEAQSKKTYAITLPNTEASTIGGSAYIKSLSIITPMKAQAKMAAVLKLTGKPTITV